MLWIKAFGRHYGDQSLSDFMRLWLRSEVALSLKYAGRVSVR